MPRQIWCASLRTRACQGLHPRQITYSTPLEFSNPTNSFKSRCSLAMGFLIVLDHVEKNVHAFRGGETGVVLLIRAVRVHETGEDLSDSFHAHAAYHAWPSAKPLRYFVAGLSRC
jgi:hypothetical protein